MLKKYLKTVSAKQHLVFILCLCCISTIQASSIKKWVDENGITHYGRTIPPQYIREAHSELNSHGVETNSKGAAKTQRQIEQEKQLAALRKEKQRLIDEQKARDKILLNMFRSDEDLIMVRDGKLNQIDAQVKLKKSQLKRQKTRLNSQQEHAAAIEREGRAIDKQLESNLNTSQSQIENSYAAILSKEQEKDRIRNKYNADLKRLRELRHRSETIEAEQPIRDDHNIKGIFYCDIANCSATWQKAINYAEKYSTTELAISSDSIWMNKPAVAKKDISITLARIDAGATQQKIFLDLSCADNISGNTFCATAQVQAITDNFNQHLKH